MAYHYIKSGRLALRIARGADGINLPDNASPMSVVIWVTDASGTNVLRRAPMEAGNPTGAAPVDFSGAYHIISAT